MSTLPSLTRTDDRTSDRQLPQLIQARTGKMTRELLLEPGKHGLGMTPSTLAADTTTTAVCGFCATGCGLRLHMRDGEAVGLTPETKYPVNLGMACPKGWEALRVLDSDDRATDPLVRKPDGGFDPVSWDTALTLFTDRFKSIQNKYGKESIAFLSTGQIASEEMAFLGALAKFGMGMVHGDGNTRQCMATAVTAYKESFGFDAPPYTYDDFEQSDCLVFVGSNPCIGHPIMWERVLRNRKSPEIIVIDPRRTETAMAATQHLQLRPKNDLSILYAITNQIIQRGYVDHSFVDQHTTGFEQLREHVAGFTTASVAEQSGISEEQIIRAADTIGTKEAVSLWWTMGVNQSYEGTRTAQAIINIALITGNIGRPGTGANSITGQCNAMGSRLWSNTTNLIGHHKFEDAGDREKVARELGIGVDSIPTKVGWSYDRIMEGIRRDEIKGLWVIATNPAHSWIHQGEARDLLDKLDFLVVQDMYHSTETARHADLILPAAAWGEKDGTFINSERRYSLIKKVRKAPGLALSDFSILRGVAHYWGLDEMFAKWTDPEAVFRLMQQLSVGQPCDISGINDYQQIDRCGGIQWPWSQRDASECDVPEPQRRLFADGKFYHDDEKAKLIAAAVTPMPEPTDDEFPVMLMTGRGTVSQWHTQTRTSKSPVLRKLYPRDPYVEINTLDARSMDVSNGDWVRVTSRRGSLLAKAMVVPTVRSGQAFMPMHYEATNQLTLSHFDPYSRQPSYKNSAVRIERSS
ncbi:nitrate reductase [Rubripirellula amarantea]|uniref:Nitrate reductase n=1 Tax=Rubripirellula amarantea TaxID=2527999 RepID=A0A5C5WQH7_9BACT|nr:nitrate reductase [Rubripirellula amarantea]MDA8744589.1 nitrate reductase [Rubripirellula amarantea]TWT53046.1 Nitrate reductase [Rubripirellula amarantea]